MVEHGEDKAEEGNEAEEHLNPSTITRDVLSKSEERNEEEDDEDRNVIPEEAACILPCQGKCLHKRHNQIQKGCDVDREDGGADPRHGFSSSSEQHLWQQKKWHTDTRPG